MHESRRRSNSTGQHSIHYAYLRARQPRANSKNERIYTHSSSYFQNYFFPSSTFYSFHSVSCSRELMCLRACVRMCVCVKNFVYRYIFSPYSDFFPASYNLVSLLIASDFILIKNRNPCWFLLFSFFLYSIDWGRSAPCFSSTIHF